MTRPLRILVSNDDGYDSHGIIALVRELKKIAEVRISAPLSNMSGASSSLSMSETVTVSIDGERMVVHGTPTDCVHIALVVGDLMPWRPDLTVSGINHGNNIGDDAMYSGTIAAAAESIQLGVPSMAFSQGSVPTVHFPPKHLDDAAIVARELVVSLKDRLISGNGTMLNINIPDLPLEEMGQPVVCRLGMSHLDREVMAFDGYDDAGYATFRFGDTKAIGRESGTDIDAISKGNISITPLSFDLTDRGKISQVSEWLKT